MKPISHLTYLDVNNLYGWAMSQQMPTKGFKWLNDDEIVRRRDAIQRKSFPSCQKKAQSKLTLNLRNISYFVVHYRNLKFYLQQGMVITKIHRVLTFKQSPWLKDYIDYNTKGRTALSVKLSIILLLSSSSSGEGKLLIK